VKAPAVPLDTTIVVKLTNAWQAIRTMDHTSIAIAMALTVVILTISRIVVGPHAVLQGTTTVVRLTNAWQAIHTMELTNPVTVVGRIVVILTISPTAVEVRAAPLDTTIAVKPATAWRALRTTERLRPASVSMLTVVMMTTNHTAAEPHAAITDTIVATSSTNARRQQIITTSEESTMITMKIGSVMGITALLKKVIRNPMAVVEKRAATEAITVVWTEHARLVPLRVPKRCQLG
jgi:hypothetical protein